MEMEMHLGSLLFYLFTDYFIGETAGNLSSFLLPSLQFVELLSQMAQQIT